MFANRMKINSHRTVSTSRLIGKSLPLPTLEEIMNIKKEIKIYG